MDGKNGISIQQIYSIHWIITELQRHRVSYQVVGGLAAKLYGATRELADIDIYINYSKSADFLTDIKKYIIWGPERQKDEHWDVTYLKMDYEGQRIEIGDSDNASIFDNRVGKWVSQHIDYTSSENKTIAGKTVYIMPLKQLIDYKSALGRNVDKQDIQEIMIAGNRD